TGSHPAVCAAACKLRYALGYGSRPHVEKPVKTGTGPRSARPAGVAQIGYAVGDHSTAHGGGPTGYKGEKLHHDNRTFQPVEFGNKLATNVGRGGPGAGRTLYGQSGQQGCHGQPAQGQAPITNTKGQWPRSEISI